MNAPAKISHLTFLVVDDEPDNLEVVCDILSFYGARVESAGDGKEALSMLATLKPDLIITDLSMPVMDGWALLAAIRKDPSLERIPVVALTAHAMQGDRERGIAVGFSTYLTKPINAMTLVSDLLESAPSLTSGTASTTAPAAVPVPAPAPIPVKPAAPESAATPEKASVPEKPAVFQTPATSEKAAEADTPAAAEKPATPEKAPAPDAPGVSEKAVAGPENTTASVNTDASKNGSASEDAAAKRI